MFRPNDLELSTEYDAGADGAGGGAAAPATVSEVANLGWVVRYTLRFDDDVEVEYPVGLAAGAVPALQLDVGQRVYVRVRPEAMMAFSPEEIESTPVVR
jgi:sulfate transport system ATP-binding protein